MRSMTTALGVCACLLTFAIALSVTVTSTEAVAANSQPQQDAYEWDLPPGFPQPVVPADNPMSTYKVQLGRRLFHDTRLSLDRTFSCATCHRPALAFTEGRRHSVGVTNEDHPRGAMSLANIAYANHFNWDNPNVANLEEQLTTPLFGHDPVEMGMPSGDELVSRLSEDWQVGLAFQAAFPEQELPLTAVNVGKALAAFQRTLISGNSAFDRYLYGGEEKALTSSARRGMRLFFSDRLSCSNCHGRFTFSGPIHHVGSSTGAESRQEFHNTGLYDFGDGSYTPTNPGLVRHTGEAADRGRFKAPTLRNIAVTAPYMHDGLLQTLDEVLDHYAQGGRAANNSFKSPQVTGFHLSCDERQDLHAFFDSLTDWSFLHDPRFRDPNDITHSHK